MRRATVEELIRNFTRNHPGFQGEVAGYYQDGPMGLVVKLKSGKAIWYDDINKSLRRLPDNPHEMTSDQFRYEFKKRIEKILIFRSMTQNDLAEKIGVDPSQLNRYLNGKNIPSFFIVDKIAKALDCSVDDLRYSERREN